MVFRVDVSPQALADFDSIARYIRERGSFESAEKWFNGIIAAIRSLDQLPERCALAEESKDLQTEVRLLLHGKRNRRYKIYFAIHHESQTVRVFHVRHWSMKPAEADELGDLMAETNEIETSGAGT
jgi:plasmid stabilization system protein ParE